MISKEEFFRRLKEKHPDNEGLSGLAKAGEKVVQSAEKLRGKTITLSLPSDMALDSIVAYVVGIEEQLSELGILTRAKGGSFPSYGFFPDVKNYINWQQHVSKELTRREYFYDLIAGRQYDPVGRKLAVRQTVNTNSEVLREVIGLCRGEIVGYLEEADTAVYLGRLFCDPETNSEDSRYPLYGEILPWLKGDKDRAALILYNGREASVCCDEEDLHILRHLANERGNILFMPLGDMYKGRIFLT